MGDANGGTVLMSGNKRNQVITDVIRLIEGADYGFALTGAGVSTLSGIPDFRTDKSGVW